MTAPISRTGSLVERHRAGAELDHIAAHADLPVFGHLQIKRGRSAHELALSDVHAQRQRTAHRQAPTAEVGRRRTGGRILEHRAAARKEETRQRLPVSSLGEHVGHADAILAADGGESSRFGGGTAHGIERAQRNDQLFLAGLDPQRTLADIALGKPERIGEQRPRYLDFPEARARRGERPAIEPRAHRNQPRLHFKTHDVPAEIQAAAHVRASERRVACERHLIAGREDTHASVSVGPRWRAGRRWSPTS